MAAPKSGIRLKAEAHFIENIESTQKEIAELYKVSPKTIGGWYEKYEWKQRGRFAEGDRNSIYKGGSLDICEYLSNICIRSSWGN